MVAVTFNDGTAADVKVRQLPLAEYEKAFGLFNDEMGLTALIANQPKAWLIGGPGSDVPGLESGATQDSRLQTRDSQSGVTPESYEALRAAAEEVNQAGFFAWSARRSERERQAQAQMMHALAALPPDAIEQITQLGMAAGRNGLVASAARTLPTSSPKRR